MNENDHDFHIRRARDELDLAYHADDRLSMTVHFRLWAMHMERAEALSGLPPRRVARPVLVGA